MTLRMSDVDEFTELVSILDSMGPENVMGMWHVMTKVPKSLSFDVTAMCRTVGTRPRNSYTSGRKSDKDIEPSGSGRRLRNNIRSMARMEALQCPFNWKVVPIDADIVEELEDSLFLSKPAWYSVSQRIGAVYSLILDGHLDRARRLLVQLYMVLLDMPLVCSFDDDSLRKYRLAIRHVVDSMWVWYKVIIQSGYKGLKVSNYTLYPDLERLIKRVMPFDSFPKEQKAAIYILHSASGTPIQKRSEILIQQALDIAPNESVWLFMKGWDLQHQRTLDGKVSLTEEIESLEKSVKLHRNVDNVILLAQAYAAQKTDESYLKAKDLLLKAYSEWPDHLTVLNAVGQLCTDVDSPLYNPSTAIESLQRAVSISNNSKYFRFNLGIALLVADKFQSAKALLCEFKDIKEAEEALNMIAEIESHSKKKVIKKKKKKITCGLRRRWL